jgi:hypothetical protein
MMFLLLTVASGLLQVVDEAADTQDQRLLDSEQVIRQDIEEDWGEDAPEMSFAEVDATALAQMDASSLGAAMSSQLRAEVDELLGLAKAQLATEVQDQELLAQLEAAMEERIDLEVEELEEIAMQQLHQELAEAQGTSFVEMDAEAETEEELPPMDTALQSAMQQVQDLTKNPAQLEMLTTQLKREITGLEKVLEEQKERLVAAIAEMEKQGTKKNIRKGLDAEIEKIQKVMDDLKSMRRNPKKVQEQVAADVEILQTEVAALEEVLAAPEKLTEIVDQNIQRVQDALTRLYDMTSSPEKLTASLQEDLQSLQGMLAPGASFLEQEELEEEVPALEGERLLPKLAEMFLPQEELVEA